MIHNRAVSGPETNGFGGPCVLLNSLDDLSDRGVSSPSDNNQLRANFQPNFARYSSLPPKNSDALLSPKAFTASGPTVITLAIEALATFSFDQLVSHWKTGIASMITRAGLSEASGLQFQLPGASHTFS